MSFELTTLFGLGSVYLIALFGIAFITEKGWIPKKIVRHPAIYILSLGVFASVWAYYTSVGNAMRDGYGYLAHSIGISLAFLFSPLLLHPLLSLTRTYQLSSLSDLLAFRYRSPWAGTITTIVTLVGVIPLLALQIRAVSDTVGILAPDASQHALAISFCTMITLFAIFFGANHPGKSRHDGLVMAIAFESVVKLLALLSVGIFAIYAGFGSLGGMNEWLAGRPDLLEGLQNTAYLSSFHVTALLFFTAAVAMPHMFYMTFNEINSPRTLTLASWGLPLYFLLLSLPILPILWAGLKTGSTVQVEYYPVVIGMEYESEFFTLFAYLGGLSAASGLIIVITLALSNMCLNHLILPIYQPSANQDIYKWLQWSSRILITALIWAGFLFYLIPEDRSTMQLIGTLAFTSCLQFLPGIMAILYWPKGNKKGFFAGLSIGVFIWFFFLMLPIALDTDPTYLSNLNWKQIASFSLIANTILFFSVSLLTTTTDEERSSADLCALDSIKRRKRTGLVAKSSTEFIRSLGKPLGIRTATREVNRALADLGFNEKERRPYAMRSLRGRLEANLSGLMGPSIARELIDSYLPYRQVSEHGSTDLNMVENRIESYPSNLSGMAADLDKLRRYHRQILLDLPLGVCSLGMDSEITTWNGALEKLTGLSNAEAIGSQLIELPEPWGSLLNNFFLDDTNNSYKQTFELGNQRKTVNLHKSLIDRPGDQSGRHEGVVILLEDISETALLEAGLTHSERLASIGRLAAGVAHEIGNPITGIACLAQTIRDEFQDTELKGMAQQIIEQTDRTSKILQSLVSFAHAGSNKNSANNEVISIADCIEEAKTLILLDNKNKDLVLEVQCSTDLHILGDSQLLIQVLINLINNARDASQATGKIQISAEERGNKVRVSVSDEGIGIPVAIRDRVFDPFFTTKEAGEGTGLGLSLVFSIVEDFGGDIDIISPVNKVRDSGTQVILRFPCYHSKPDQIAKAGATGQ